MAQLNNDNQVKWIQTSKKMESATFCFDDNRAHCLCLLLSLCVLLMAAAMTYDYLSDSKLEYSNEDDSFD